MNIMLLRYNQTGAAAFILVLMLSFTGLLLATSASESGLNSLLLSYENYNGKRALNLAEGCADEALRRIKLNNNYGVSAGEIQINGNLGYCTVEISDTGGGGRHILSSGIIDDIMKTVSIDVLLSDNESFVLENWEDF